MYPNDPSNWTSMQLKVTWIFKFVLPLKSQKFKDDLFK
jgi:hypothetical protein